MALETAIRNSLKKFHDRKFDCFYIAVDAHETFIRPTYDSDAPFEFINDDAKTALQFLSNIDEVCLILWTSMWDDDVELLEEWLATHNIYFSEFNQNQYEDSTAYANFDSKFYFSLLLDDKAGFDPSVDWKTVIREFSCVTKSR